MSAESQEAHIYRLREQILRDTAEIERLRAAAQQALEALMWHDETVRTRGDNEAIAALRAALAQQEQATVKESLPEDGNPSFG
jgi:uncharacterized protein (UPF0147 family)